MSASLHVEKAGPQVTVQDLGRSGALAFGLSRGGAMDRMALFEGAALLGQDAGLAALEMAGAGGTFRAEGACRIALTGAPMRAQTDGRALTWNASHELEDGAVLEIGAAERGIYGYLHVGGGIESDMVLGARSAHLAGGLGRALAAGDVLSVGGGGRSGQILPSEERFGGGRVRVVPSLQTAVFPDETRARFEKTEFRKDARANRQGARMDAEGEGFGVDGGLHVVSEVIVPGDIQITGDGTPFVLLAESQTTGGYPRIGTVIPPDLARVAQAQPGAALRFEFVTLEEGRRLTAAWREARPGLKPQPLVRDPAKMTDLMSYTLIGGVTAGDDLDQES
ncbi:urea amidolyase [Roseivivax halodurans JCM 10272]|uniref:Urea amidolyase n=1 Tax=Roseivivax halodurans JCM 10272 TaxID=1449350 RepID=X7EH98_9RHOB|nr:biotin-dependent carboxyltransferase family protein [Roseivivax halodurans]ETX14488.1 urea amidolyase [Roseivivax halodurans JCM 10272]